MEGIQEIKFPSQDRAGRLNITKEQWRAKNFNNRLDYGLITIRRLDLPTIIPRSSLI